MKKLRLQVEDRASVLEQRRRLKMARSAHAYVRGNTSNFYEWLSEASTASRIPEGPLVWICGDCHVGNLGPVANTEGKVEIAIRDFDQTVMGNPAHDIIRLALSLATAARGSDLPGVTTAVMIEQVIEGYQEALLHPSQDYEDFAEIPEAVRSTLRQAVKREWRHLAEERIEDLTPRIPLGKRFWAVSPEEFEEIKTLFGGEESRKLITSFATP